jgi:hypothetical protein
MNVIASCASMWMSVFTNIGFGGVLTPIYVVINHNVRFSFRSVYAYVRIA